MLKKAVPLFTLSSVLLCAGGAASTRQTFTEQAEAPFTATPNALPDMGMAPETDAAAKHIAEMAKKFGEASMTDNGLDTGEQARLFAFTSLRDVLTDKVTNEAESLLSPWGKANFNLQVNEHGNWNGSSGSMFTPWADNNRYLTWSQLGFTQQDDGMMGNIGAGQRWVAGEWLLGYNTFYDTQLASNLQRAGFGAEAWGEYLRLSANYYQPLNGWQDETETQEQRLARGYDVTAQAWLPFYRHIFTSVSLEQYFGDRVDLFDSGTGYRNPVAVTMGLNYTPVPLVTLTAQHKQGESGLAQENLGLKLNYRFGVPLGKQLSAGEVAASSSLRGSRYDSVERSNLPVLEYRQRKTLSVFLATPPWELHPGDTVELKLQVRASHGIRQIAWQGDTQALSLTPPANNRNAEGWSVIMPAWKEGAPNEYRLSVIIEDDNGQKVTSNWITLKQAAPLLINPTEDSRYDLLPGEGALP
ncbi:YchO/YchP family invasin [Enterobacteriaceae bacterium H18W14]|uniref:YchO/YchP family invasin n=1 Tax=Dryocola boscaweniae TaxID=2925397 RepID=UPI0022F07740|nr:YchO/YchP family invasin [Dryocola boscaweniae]MCT4713621.1 YchO/YchP family invasin [Dryocola boscaweniae]